jgi:hypothetical protein
MASSVGGMGQVKNGRGRIKRVQEHCGKLKSHLPAKRTAHVSASLNSGNMSWLY